MYISGLDDDCIQSTHDFNMVRGYYHMRPTGDNAQVVSEDTMNKKSAKITRQLYNRLFHRTRGVNIKALFHILQQIFFSTTTKKHSILDAGQNSQTNGNGLLRNNTGILAQVERRYSGMKKRQK